MSMVNGKKLLIIDGPSASGKSTIIDIILENKSLPFEVAQRITTRAKRKGDENDPVYVFTNQEAFEEMIQEGALLEYKHYLFGMSYGLPVQSVESLLTEGKNVMGMINLGNISMVKEKVPECFGVLISASVETIEQRLRARQIHTEEQIEERLGNARKAKSFEPHYDLVIFNENKSAEEAAQEIINGFLAHISDVPPAYLLK
jgi:guanylate kinase